MIMAISSMASLVSIVGGPIVQNLGWRYMFIIQLPFAIVCLIAVILYVPETQFIRSSENSQQLHIRPENDSSKAMPLHIENSGGDTAVEQTETEMHDKMTYIQSLKLYTGPYSSRRLDELFISTFLVAINPATLWV